MSISFFPSVSTSSSPKLTRSHPESQNFVSYLLPFSFFGIGKEGGNGEGAKEGVGGEREGGGGRGWAEFRDSESSPCRRPRRRSDRLTSRDNIADKKLISCCYHSVALPSTFLGNLTNLCCREVVPPLTLVNEFQRENRLALPGLSL